VKDDLNWEALLKIVLAISKAGKGASLAVLDLERRLPFLCLLRFKFLIAFFVSSLSALVVGLLALSRPLKGSIEFADRNSARIDRGPTVKSTYTFFLAWNIPRLTTKVTGSLLKFMVT